jgi:integrase
MLTFDDLSTALIEDYVLNRRRSLATLLSTRLPPLRRAFGTARMNQVSVARIRGYTAARLREGAAPATVNRELAALRRMLRLAVIAGLMPTCPVIPMLEESAPRQGFVTSHQFGLLREALPERLRDFVAFLFYSSWRPSEARSLAWSWVDLEAREIRLPPACSKNGLPRTLPLRGELAAIIDRALLDRVDIASRPSTAPDDDYVFHPVNIRRAWTAATDACGLTGLLIYDLRRTAIRNFVRAGVPEAVAMRLSGHRTRTVFERYNIVSSDDLAKAVASVA